MKSIDSKIYSAEFYLNQCLGSEEFKLSCGKKLHPNIEKLIGKINLIKNMRILDVGCGRGDIVLALAKQIKEAVGIDYSQDAIRIANSTKKNFPTNIQKKVTFRIMNVKKINFPNSYFDLIICIDVFEHLYKDELEVALSEISRVLKKDGILFCHTVTNKILYDYTYKYYILPMNKFLTWIDKKIKNINYRSLPNNPRCKEEQRQHVNEPTYYYLLDLFKKHNFKGKIKTEIGYLKNIKNIKTIIYNFLLTLYPISKLFPLSLLFGWAFICVMKNKKTS